MALIIQKYGGTSVGDVERILTIAEKIIQTRELGHDLVVVVSAMAGETDRLVTLAQQLAAVPDPRELDVLLSTGEQIVIALLSLALINRGCAARSYTGAQVQIRTDSAHNKAHVLGIDVAKIQADLLAGRVVVVAGFQGVDELGNITTLGRGGSDTTAVALAAALKADECQIYTDVDGVYTADPKVVSSARKLPVVTTKQMLEMSSNGAKVMQVRAVEFAESHHVPVRVLSTFRDGTGTLITANEADLGHNVVSGIAFSREEAQFVINSLDRQPNTVVEFLKPLSESHIEVDMITQTLTNAGATELAFTVHDRDFDVSMSILEKIAKNVQAQLAYHRQVSKLSLVGVGLRSHASIVTQMLQALNEVDIEVQLIATSEIKITAVINQKDVEKGIRVLHQVFGLSEEPVEQMSAPDVNLASDCCLVQA